MRDNIACTKQLTTPFVKVCGMTSCDAVKAIDSHLPLCVGFIFYDASPRNAFALPVEDICNLSSECRKIGVFVDAGYEEIIGICRPRNIDVVQLHGSESPELCRKLGDAGYTVIKAFSLSGGNKDDLNDRLAAYVSSVDYFLFDTAGRQAGGNGLKFDWTILDNYNFPVPYILSGGIGPDDVQDVISVLNSKKAIAGVDINSRFEISPGVKNIKTVNKFINNLYHNAKPTD